MIDIPNQHAVEIAPSILIQLSEFIQVNFPKHRVVILTDENTENHCLPLLNWAESDSILKAEVLSVPAGESSKELSIVESLSMALIEMGANRNTILLNLGGGMIGDLGAFLASTYKRGIPFIHLPTSLLAMVDATTGGKCGVNLGRLKNQIGLISYPERVFCGTDFLDSLPQRELHSGYAEIAKHGLISNPTLWKKIVQQDLNSIPTEEIIEESINVKAKKVLQDPTEKNVRKELNFGHTVGHALESLSQEKEAPLLHGEAIWQGMLIEAYYSNVHHTLSPLELDAIVKYITSVAEIKRVENDDVQRLVELMESDKKNMSDRINFSLLSSIGSCSIDHELHPDQIVNGIEWFNSICDTGYNPG